LDIGYTTLYVYPFFGKFSLGATKKGLKGVRNPQKGVNYILAAGKDRKRSFLWLWIMMIG
jgi:hypothetical protein